MKDSLAKRLTFRIMAVVMVMLALITSFVYVSVRDYMLNESQERYLGILLKAREKLRRTLSDVYVATTNNVHDIERDIDNPDLMPEHMERIVRQNKMLASCGLLRILLNVYKHTRANGHAAILRGMADEVEEVFSLSGFLQLFKVEDV